MAAASTALSVGEIIADRYEIEERLGEGGMAVVYRGRHTGTGKPCALKFLLPQLSKVDKHREQFLNEARVAGRIGTHPHVVDVFDTGIDSKRQLPYIAMELLEGLTLSDFAAAQARVPWDTARIVLEQLGEALDAAHQAGVIHRDLKPTNVFVTQDRRGEIQVKVLDFGIAKVLEGSAEDRTATQVGTPWYCAPEQLGSSMRKLAGERGVVITMGVSPATDVWAFGLVAYELLCGVQPKQYWGSMTMADQMIKVALDDRAPATERAGDRAEHLPPGFDDWFLRCLRHNAQERFPSAGEAAAALGALLTAEPPTVRPLAATGDFDQTTTPVGRMSPIAATPTPPPAPLAQPAPPPPTPASASTPGATPPGPPPAIADPASSSGLFPSGGSPPIPPGAVQARHQPDTASSWQEMAPPSPTGSRAVWVVVGGGALALAIGATAALLTIRPTGLESEANTVEAERSAEAGSAPAADPALPSEQDATSAPEGDDPDGAGRGGGRAAPPAASASAAVAAAPPAGPDAPAAPPTVAPSPTRVVPPSPAPTTAGQAKPPSQGKGFDELFGKR